MLPYLESPHFQMSSVVNLTCLEDETGPFQPRVCYPTPRIPLCGELTRKQKVDAVGQEDAHRQPLQVCVGSIIWRREFWGGATIPSLLELLPL